VAVALAISVWAAPSGAQRTPGIGDDAAVLRRGRTRVRVLTRWENFNERFGEGTRSKSDGSREPLGIDFVRDTLGVRQVEALTPVQASIRALAAQPTFVLSLGATRVSREARIVTTPIIAEVGLTSRLTIGANLPYVRSRVDVFADMNANRTEGNVGVNPALTLQTARDANDAVRAELQTAVTRLQTAISACDANPAGTGCPPGLPANRDAALALIGIVNAFSTGVVQLYGTKTTAGSSFIPRAGSDAQKAIVARIGAFNTSFKTLLASTGDVVTAVPFPAQTPITLPQLQAILADPTLGILAPPIESVQRSHIGDVEVGAKYLLLDSFTRDSAEAGLRYRLALAGLFRVGSGQAELPDNFADIGTGDGQNDVEVRAIADLQVRRRVMLGLGGRYVVQLADQQFMRIPVAVDEPIAAAFRHRKVERDLGDLVEVDVSPRYTLNSYLSIGAWYLFRWKAQDVYTGSFAATTPDDRSVTLDASILAGETGLTDQRVGGSVSYSTLTANAAGRVRWPFEITLSHGQSIAGSGNAPKVFVTQLEARIYRRVFGR
jgi:hypothetical protein